MDDFGVSLEQLVNRVPMHMKRLSQKWMDFIWFIVAKNNEVFLKSLLILASFLLYFCPQILINRTVFQMTDCCQIH